MVDSEIVETVKWIKRLQMGDSSGVRKAFVEGLILRLEDHGVTEKDLDRLGF